MKPVSDNSPALEIVQQELRLLGRVTSTLSELSTAHAGTPDYDAALVSLRDQIAEAKPEDLGPLVEQMMRIAAIAQRYGRGRDLPIDPASPYFAHLRLEEDERCRDVLIGKRGFIDREKAVQIVDWRNAPVSRIYYRYEEGDDYEERFGNRTLEGQIKCRRTVSIDEGLLRRIGAPQGTFFCDEQGRWFETEATRSDLLSGGQGKASRPPVVKTGKKGSKLGHAEAVLRRDKHLPEIAALIDPAQFELITHPDSGLVVLQGGAGTGKTTVALHRVAYLNYAAPKRFRPDRMLVVVPSRAMVRYVERVLPSLGVRGVRVQTARRWFAITRQKVLPQSPKVYNDDTPDVVLRFKKHPMLLALAREFVHRQLRDLEQLLHDNLRDMSDAEAVRARWSELAARSFVRRCIGVRDWARTASISSLTRHRAESTLQQLARRARDVVGDWGEMMTDRSLLASGVERHCPGEFSANDIDQVCRWCTRQLDAPTPSTKEEDDDWGDENPFISLDGRDERQRPNAGRWDRPDDALLLYLHQQKLGAIWPPGKRPLRYEHIVLDEAQDLSAIEIKVLIEATTKRRCASLAGDVLQRLVFDNHFTNWESLLDSIGAPVETTATLQLGYRSTNEVMALARALLGDMAAPAITSTRSGAPVELHRFGSQGEAVAALAEALRSLTAREPLASVALIARYRAQAVAYAEALSRAEVANLRVVDHDFSFKPGIEATHVSQVKGLEFDYVVALDVNAANYPDTTQSRHLLHIAATRAAHQLWLIATSTPSPILPKTI